MERRRSADAEAKVRGVREEKTVSATVERGGALVFERKCECVRRSVVWLAARLLTAMREWSGARSGGDCMLIESSERQETAHGGCH